MIRNASPLNAFGKNVIAKDDSIKNKSKSIITNIDNLDDKMLAPNAKQLHQISVFKGVKNYNVKSTTPINIGDNMYLLDNVTDPSSTLLEVKVNDNQWQNLLSSESCINVMQEISNLIYSKFNDDFDFIHFVLNTPYNNDIVNNLGFYGRNYVINNNIKGIGLANSDFSPYYGSNGKLKSIMYFPFYDAILSGPALHELCHNWAAYISPIPFLPDNMPINQSPIYSSHWGISNAGGQLGGFKYVRVVEENSGGVVGKTLYQGSMYPDINADGSYKTGGFGINSNSGNAIPYSDIELYLMGLKTEQELRDSNFHLDIYSGNSIDGVDFNNGYFYATNVTSYTIDDIIALNGSRIPDASSSQKQFKILTISLTPDTATISYCSSIAQNVKWFAGDVGDITNPNLYNFRQATGNSGSLVVDSIKNSLKFISSATLSNIALSGGTMSPAFNPYIFNYTVTVTPDLETIDITGTSDNPNATITGNTTAMPIALNDYTDTCIVVTNENGISQTYYISVLRGILPPVSYTWQIDNPEKETQIYIDAKAGETCIINWGDGTAPTTFTGKGLELPVVDNSTMQSHQYNQVGTYKVTITGESELESPLLQLSQNVWQDQVGYHLTSIDVRKATDLLTLGFRVTDISQLDVSRNTKLKWLDCELSKLSSLNLSSNPSLKELLCNNNLLNNLDIENCKLLTRLHCDGNEIENLNVSHNRLLNMFYCDNNKLKSIDVSNNPFLKYFGCGNNLLSNIDVSYNPNLDYLGCYGNQISKLDISNNTKLTYLQCSSNLLENLNVSNLDILEILDVYSNKLTNLDISNLLSLKELQCQENSLSFTNIYNIFQQISGINNKYLGSQILPDSTVSLNTPIAIDTVFYGVNTVFEVEGGVLGTNYILNNGEINFLTSGSYNVSISNPAIVCSDGTAKIIQTFIVSKRSQNLEWEQTLAAVYGDAPISLTCSASSGLDISYSSDNNSVVAVNGSTLSIMGAGIANIAATQNGNENYNAANTVTKTITVTKAPLTVTANDLVRAYGEENPPFTFSFTGFRNGETAAVIDALPSGSTAADLLSNVGNYAIIASGASDTNYDFSYQPGNLEVTKALLIITADNKTRKQGEDNPTFTLTYSGFKNSENENVLDVLPAVSCVADANSSVGMYDIVLSGGSDNNYTYNLINGTLEVTFSTTVESILAKGISVYPNPTKDKLKIDCEEIIETMEITDLLGNVLLRRKVNAKNAEIPMDRYQSGCYLLHIVTGSGKGAVKKIIKR
ncbi:hypothetical protein CYCD_13560 [Tenuifilaceae bacterium CYCD]|nr:hypothetical protein CYCD_13560 [Tenuifilaceae bacterium CYCD]